MKIRKVLCQIVVWSASLGITAPQLSYGAEAATRPTPSAVAPVRDVALSTRGNLQGKVVDSSGKPLVASQVQLRQNGKVAGQAATDVTGKFTVAGVRPGLYEVATDNVTGVYRVWSSQSVRRRRSMACYSSTARMWYALREETGPTYCWSPVWSSQPACWAASSATTSRMMTTPAERSVRVTSWP